MDKPYIYAGEKGEYIDSYYSRTLDDKGGFDALENDVTTSICVIGGGMAGVATAHSLVEKGEKPILIEANRIGWGASGRNGGFVSSGFSKGPKEVVKMVGESHARELYKLTNAALDTVNRRMGDQRDYLIEDPHGHFEVSWFNEPGKVENHVEFMNDLMEYG